MFSKTFNKFNLFRAYSTGIVLDNLIYGLLLIYYTLRLYLTFTFGSFQQLVAISAISFSKQLSVLINVSVIGNMSPRCLIVDKELVLLYWMGKFSSLEDTMEAS